ncbi:MAG: PIG-L family deacetylase [Chloroflexota bacterium]|nr:PIG-L family deacetylase [Chloroflexota bacterium]
MSLVTRDSQPELDLLFVLAHPDDESFGFAGLMAWAQTLELRIGLVCATRGEAGKISDPSLGTPATLGAVRERELRAAMSMVGVSPVRLLSYRDSGMAGTPENQEPRSLVQASHEAVLADIVFQIRDLRPHAVITFGPDGVYKHPDHVRIGEIATRAVEVAASAAYPFLGESWPINRLYHAAVAREDLMAMSEQTSGPFVGTPPEAIAKMGVPRSEITHVFDVADFIDLKLRVIAAHATQLPFNPEDGPIGDPAMRSRLGRESLKRIPLAWSDEDKSHDVLDVYNTLGEHRTHR